VRTSPRIALRKDDEREDVRGEEEEEEDAVVLIFVVVKQPLSLFGVCLARSRVPFATRSFCFFFCREREEEKKKNWVNSF
jgi:hypothetical protein